MNRTSRRFKGLGNGTEYFHCVSRVGDRRMVLKQREKEEFIRIMRLYEGVYALRILSYCLMTNHFHILLEVPKRPPQLELPDDGALVTRVSAALGDMAGRGLREELLRLRKSGMDTVAEALRERYFSRMWDVSSYMQVVKQRFTQWYNRSRSKRRRGTLWEDRFRSVLVAGEADALKAMAVYIDLNPVRAGIVKDPADYRWSSYGEAMGGGEKAVAGLAWLGGLVAHGGGNRNFAAREGLEAYRCALFGRAEERTDGAGRVVKRGADAGKIKEVLGNRGACADAGIPASPGEIFHGRGGDREQGVSGGGVRPGAGAAGREAQGRGAAAARAVGKDVCLAGFADGLTPVKAL